jgi:carbamate kinase
MLVVVALGGNALLRRGEPMDLAVQRANVKRAAAEIAKIAEDHTVVLTHGNGPQVGLLALQNVADPTLPSYPLDVLDAESEGMVGYLLEQELGRHIEPVATLLTQVVVDPADVAFDHPTKPVGPVYSSTEAHELARARRWSIAPEAGGGWRRVVPSPDPLEIVELSTIKLLVEHRVLVTCAGGGGIPVARDHERGLVGLEAVIDKDLAASLLARELAADVLLLLTDVDGVYRDWGTPRQHRISVATVDELRALELPAGSMGPKVEAICRFVEAGGRVGAIGSLEEAEHVLCGQAGTTVRHWRC